MKAGTPLDGLPGDHTQTADVLRPNFPEPLLRAVASPLRQIRVCHLTPSLTGGGAEERVARTLGAMDRGAFELSWLGFGHEEHGVTRAAGAGVEIVSVERRPARGIEPTVILDIARILGRLRPDVLHTHNWSTGLYGIIAARLAGVPVVIYGEGGRDDPAPASKRRRAVMRALAPHVDHFTAVCHFLGRELEKLWRVPRERISVIETGVDLDAVARLPSRAEVRGRLGLGEGAVVVGAMAGRFRPVKRIPELIDAVGCVAASHADVHLVLMGDPLGEADALLARASAWNIRDRVHLVGHQPRHASLIRGFDVAVNCSRFEGASNAILEAMAAGVPMVATAVGGTPEQVEDGVTGLLVQPDSLASLVVALRRMVQEPELRARTGAAARARIAALHGQGEMVRRYSGLYRRLADAAAGRGRPAQRSMLGVGESLLRIVAAEG